MDCWQICWLNAESETCRGMAILVNSVLVYVGRLIIPISGYTDAFEAKQIMIFQPTLLITKLQVQYSSANYRSLSPAEDFMTG